MLVTVGEHRAVGIAHIRPEPHGNRSLTRRRCHGEVVPRVGRAIRVLVGLLINVEHAADGVKVQHISSLPRRASGS